MPNKGADRRIVAVRHLKSGADFPDQKRIKKDRTKSMRISADHYRIIQFDHCGLAFPPLKGEASDPVRSNDLQLAGRVSNFATREAKPFLELVKER